MPWLMTMLSTSACLPCMQLHKNAQLGLKPAPNGRDFRWSSFGAPPPPGGLPPSQVGQEHSPALELHAVGQGDSKRW